MTSQNPEPGYRGSLPTRDDRLARPWILLVVGIFLLVIALSVVGIPSRLIPDPTPVPLPSLPSFPESVEPSPSASASAEPSESGSEAESPSESASESP